MFDYFYSIITSLVGTAAILVGVQSAQQPEVPVSVRSEDKDGLTIFFDDRDDRRTEDIDDVLGDINRAPVLLTENGIYYDESTRTDDLPDEYDDWDDEYEDEWEHEEEDEDDEYEDEEDDNKRRNSQKFNNIVPAVQPIVQNTVSAPGTLALSVVQKHATAKDCWVVYQGIVYDITALIPWHPGGASAITPYCGTSQDFARAFAGQHGTSQVAALMKRAIQKGSLQ